MLKYVYVSPSDFLVVLLGRGVARVAVGAMGALITLVVGVVALGVPFDPARSTGRCSSSSWRSASTSIVAIGVFMAADLHPDAPGGVVLSGGRRRSPVPHLAARCSRSPSCPHRSRSSAC